VALICDCLDAGTVIALSVLVLAVGAFLVFVFRDL